MNYRKIMKCPVYELEFSGHGVYPDEFIVVHADCFERVHKKEGWPKPLKGYRYEMTPPEIRDTECDWCGRKLFNRGYKCPTFKISDLGKIKRPTPQAGKEGD